MQKRQVKSIEWRKFVLVTQYRRVYMVSGRRAKINYEIFFLRMQISK